MGHEPVPSEPVVHDTRSEVSDPEVDTGAETAAACYRHPQRPALTRCSRCERPICSDDLIEAPVGYQCPGCADGGQPVRRLQDLTAAPVTRTLVVLIAVGFVVTLGRAFSPAGLAMGLIPEQLGQGEVWRLVTSGFVHAGIIHIGFNGYLLWLLGHQLEPLLGRARFLTLFVGGLVGGSLGVVLLSYLTVVTPLASIPLLGDVFATSPRGLTVGASGAVFGLFGAAMVAMRHRGIDPWRSDIGTLVLLNLAITFVFSSAISVGGHLGGLAIGAVIGRLVFRDRQRPSLIAAIAVTVALGVLTIVLARAIAAALTGL
jgi:membrane associated rhomboid family serine protease